MTTTGHTTSTGAITWRAFVSCVPPEQGSRFRPSNLTWPFSARAPYPDPRERGVYGVAPAQAPMWRPPGRRPCDPVRRTADSSPCTRLRTTPGGLQKSKEVGLPQGHLRSIRWDPPVRCRNRQHDDSPQHHADDRLRLVSPRTDEHGRDEEYPDPVVGPGNRTHQETDEGDRDHGERLPLGADTPPGDEDPDQHRHQREGGHTGVDPDVMNGERWRMPSHD